MKDFIKDNWGDFHRDRVEKAVFLITITANRGREIIAELEKYQAYWNIKGILDNDKTKQGQSVEYFGKKLYIKSIDEIDSYKDDEVVELICGTYITELAEQLNELTQSRL